MTGLNTTLSEISVCMATFNGERFLAEQIESVLSQLTPSDELIISDDGSSDSTFSIIKSFADPRIQLLINPNPGSPVRNFEHALRHARGNLIFLADQDDVWEQNKLTVQAELLDRFDLVVSDCSLIDATGALLADSFYDLRGSGPGFFKNLYKNSYLGCCMAFRRSIMEKTLPFPPAIAMHDIWLGLVAELYGTVHFCPDKLVRYRRHDSTATQTAGKSSLTLAGQLSYRWQFLYSVIRRKVLGR